MNQTPVQPSETIRVFDIEDELPRPVPSHRPITTKATFVHEQDISSFLQGTNVRAYEKLGAHLLTVNGIGGTHFAVWAPNAERVQVMGDFNGWDKITHALHPLGQSGIWVGFAAGIGQGTHYKYHVVSRFNGHAIDKADPFAFWSEAPPETASVVWDLDYNWGDHAWMAERRGRNSPDAAVAIYEVHLGSWMRVSEEGNRWMSYRELAPKLAEYIQLMGFTHVELLPVTEHPFYGSWGYQTTGYFAPTSRYGTPQDFMFFVDYLHHRDIGVILDWVPSHFPTDGHSLAYFDGTHLFEHVDPRKGFHPDWNSAIFNYGRNEVRSFLISSALFWLDTYHVDGLRLDGVASMLYLDYSRKAGEWIPNQFGGRENLEAIDFLRQLNLAVTQNHPEVITIAEESTAWPMVSRAVADGGLGFHMKWDMGWMHDTLRYFKRNPIHRSYHHGELAFRMVYAFSENYILPLSHDEVVHGKGSLFGMMSGDEWQKYANLRLLFGYMYGQPGKKLLFMGAELAQWPEWSHESSVEWSVSADRYHGGAQKWLSDLNRLYVAEPALHELDFHPKGFQWIDYNDTKNTTLSFVRRARSNDDIVLVVLNFTPVVIKNYRVGVPRGGFWKELLNSDSQFYGGGAHGNAGGVQTEPVKQHRQACSVRLILPPLSALFLVNREARTPG
ncbi:MAG: 1,4-alpha-glucan branching protein GlgB [Verrucomicrobia bacterium]|nr:1,4-alpha-glucan branching protein GlgB [Verrucomicrobiota bacterium]